ncbi:hypothetical protein LAT59_01350 [Candidatus Gracilibacteria bacterium]|nr:hypothetical protein [Candidatus Gracilibacteria bacterium]
MKLGKIKHLFTGKKKKDFFAEFSKEFLKITKDILLLYRNFIHWNISKICINIGGIFVGLALAFPFFLLAVFIALIDPIPWGTFLVYQMQGISPVLEALSYASMYTFSFVVMTFAMICTLIAFLIGNAYSNVLYARLYTEYINGEKLAYRDNIYFSYIHIRRFVTVALWSFLLLFIPLILIALIVGIFIILFGSEIMSFEAFSFSLLGLTLISVFLFSYIIFRLLFSVILMSLDSSKKIIKHSGWYYIKKSIEITSGWKKYFKFLFVLCLLFLILYPFRAVGDEFSTDVKRLRGTIEYRALVIASPEQAEQSGLRETAEFYDSISDENLFANYRGATMLSIIWSIIGFLVLSGLYTMVFVSFYRRVLS